MEHISHKMQVLKTPFAKCRWFTRGWTLQELLAPSNMTFFNASWQQIGDKHGLAPMISYNTGIDIKIVRDSRQILGQSAWQRMCWARSRETTRTEDMAYCLLGIFNINMPLIYGEGWKAFQRLQEEITRTQGDVSILLWSSRHMSKPQYRPPAYRHARLLPAFRGAFAWAVSEFLSREEVEASIHGVFNSHLVDDYGMAVPATIEMGAQQTCVVKGAAVCTVPVVDDDGFATQSVDTVLEIPVAQGLFYRSVQKRAEGYVFGGGASAKTHGILRRFKEDGQLRLTSQQAAIQFDMSNDSNVHFAITGMNTGAYSWSSWPPLRWEPWAGSWTYKASEFLAHQMSEATILGICHFSHKLEFRYTTPSGQKPVNGPPLGYLLNLICIVGTVLPAESKSSSSSDTLSDLSFIGGVSVAESIQNPKIPYNLHHLLSKHGLQRVARAARATIWDRQHYQFFQSGQTTIVFVKEARMRLRIKYSFPDALKLNGSNTHWNMCLELESELHHRSNTWVKRAWDQPIPLDPNLPRPT
ncbi:hypothetical protein Golomagni_05686 [Golovinomyces magnicellulatus]|nr:hypothetical protein Golomagni_05686 [Golovinomyces magnicellulatus]